MDSPQEYERKFAEWDAAVRRIPYLESEVAQERGAKQEAEAALSREQSRNVTLQAERDAAVARVVEIETALRQVGGQVLAMLTAMQPHRMPAVEKLIEEATRTPKPQDEKSESTASATPVESIVAPSLPAPRERMVA